MHRKAKQGRSKVKVCPDAALHSTEMTERQLLGERPALGLTATLTPGYASSGML